MKRIFIIACVFGGLAISSCKKNECSQCHYDKDGQEIELGERCGKDIDELEANGYNDNGTVYEAHCGEH